METSSHFSIMHTICRMALASSGEAVRHQIERLSDALQQDGDAKSAQSLRQLLTRSAREQEMVPRQLSPSKGTLSLPGEALLPSTSLPADRETGARLVEATFPGEAQVLRPVFPASLDRAIQMLLDEWRHASLLASVGAEPSMSCLLTGAPGTGKTSLALWLANELGLPVLTARVDAMMSSFLGTTSRNIAQVFGFANRFRCVLLLDELDSLAKQRDDTNEVGEIKRVVNALLQNLDTRASVGVTLGITNHPKLLDPAVWRRFTAQIDVPLPSAEAREAIVARHGKAAAMEPAVVRFLSAVTTGCSGAEVESVVNLYKKRWVLEPKPVSAAECMRDVAYLSSGRLSSDVRALLRRDDPEMARWIRKETDGKFTLADLSVVLARSKSTIARWADEAESR